jgi:hypothetical protein
MARDRSSITVFILSFDRYFLPVSRALDHAASKSFGLSLFVVLK